MKRKTEKMLLSFLFMLTLTVGLLPEIESTALADGSHTITFLGTQHRSVTVSPASGMHQADDTVTVTATPEDGYRLKRIRATYQSVEPVEEGLDS